MHVAVWTRPELAFACARLARFTAIPNRIIFEAIKRAGRFLYANPHRPIVYPRKMNLTGVHLITNHYDKDKSDSHAITNAFASLSTQIIPGINVPVALSPFLQIPLVVS